MFSELFVFEKQRSGTQAVGFYLFYLFAIIVLSALGGIIFARDFSAGVTMGQILAIVVCLGLSFLVLFKKNKLRSAGPVAIALLSGLGAYILGGLLGLAATAYLSTLEPD